MKNKYVFTGVLLAVILFVGSVLTTTGEGRQCAGGNLFLSNVCCDGERDR